MTLFFSKYRTIIITALIASFIGLLVPTIFAKSFGFFKLPSENQIEIENIKKEYVTMEDYNAHLVPQLEHNIMVETMLLMLLQERGITLTELEHNKIKKKVEQKKYELNLN